MKTTVEISDSLLREVRELAARKIARAANYACSFDTEEFPDHPVYSGNPWFLPAVGGYYWLRDRIDRMLG